MRAQDEGSVLPPELAAFLATTFELSCSTLLTPSPVLKRLAAKEFKNSNEVIKALQGEMPKGESILHY